MKRRANRIVSSVLLILFLFSQNVAPVEAHHYTYYVEDPISQTYLSPLADNWVMFKWWQWDVVKWYADGGLYFDALNAIDTWRASTAMPDMLWEYEIEEANADVRFYSGMHPDAPDTTLVPNK